MLRVGFTVGFLFGDFLLFCLHRWKWDDTGSTVGLVLLWYLTDTPQTRNKRKRKKMSLAKLKEFFGNLSWLPQPEGA